MYKRKEILSLILLFVLPVVNCIDISAQTQLKGKISESSGAPLGYANVLLLQAADSAFVRGEIADEDGTFLFKDIHEGNYLFEFSMVGYSNKYSEFFTILSTSKHLIWELP